MADSLIETWSRRPRSLLASAACASCLVGCGPGDEVDIGAVGTLDYHGRVESIETLGRYTSLDAHLLLQLATHPIEVSVENDYFLYRVTYPTSGVHGGTTRVSGLVAIPATRDIKGVVSWQHGTNTYRPSSISKPSIPEGFGVTAMFASDGFMTVAPDYIGLGVSKEMQGYYHWPSTVSTIVDLLEIAEIMLDGVARSPDRDLYLAGFSQGGGATAAVQKFLEEQNPTGLSLRGAATISGAFNPRAISFPHAIASDAPFYLALLLAAFSYVYERPLDGIVRDPYKDRLLEWFDGTHDKDFLDEHLPEHVSELLSDTFMQDFAAGIERPVWLYEALEQAGTYDYAPVAPLRMFFGSKDDTVIPEEAHAALSHMQALGGNAAAVNVGPYDHDEIVLPSLPPIQRWFDRLEGANQ
ncbi:MAG TPA: alpha/beta hydrolase [Polyangiaceae bacterium]|nr:alpha/beta hydrolase [Polyangiaceae bacterium]